MKTITKLFSIAALAALTAPAVQAQETVVYDFRDRGNFDINRQFSVDKDEEPWKWGQYVGSDYDYSGPEQYESSYIDGYYSSGIYTPDLNLEAGKYKVYTTPRRKNSDYSFSGGPKMSNLSIYLGQGNITESAFNSGAYTLLGKVDNIGYMAINNASSINSVTPYQFEFEITTPGNYKVIFFNKDAGVTLHQTYIVKLEGGGTTDPDPEPPVVEPDPVVPGAVSNLTASVNDREVTLTFNLPFEGTKGESLATENLTYRIYRDSESISSKGRQTAGSSIVYVDSDVPYGTYVYSVEVAIGEQTSEAESVSVTVEQPKADPVASITLPFSDSFAGAVLDESVWSMEGSGSDKAKWIVTSVIPQSYLGNWVPADDDGGFVYYDGWYTNNGDMARLITAPITKESSTAPVVDFMFRHSHSRGCTNYLKLQVSADDGPWQDVEGAQVYTYVSDLDDGGWRYYKFPIADYIKNCTTYRVAFTGYTTSISTYLPVDAVNIYNMASTDLRLEGVEIPAKAIAGKNIDIAVTLTNMGGSTLPADGYTVTAEGTLPVDVEFTTQDIPSLGTVTLIGKCELTAEDVLDGPDYSVSVKVNVPGNAGSETLTSEASDIEAAFVDYKTPSFPVVAYDSNGDLKITWEGVKDLGHEAINLNENFNGLQAHEQIEVDGERVWQEGAKGNFNGFISLDLDKQDGGTYYSTSGSEFQVFKDFMTGSMPSGHSGQYIGLTVPANIQQDDWLITPELNAAPSALISLQARIAYIYRESDSYNNTLEVLYSTEDYSRSNPASSFTHFVMETTSKATSSDLPHDGLYHWLRINNIPSEAKYVAIHFKTKSAMQSGVWVDRIMVSEADQQPLAGYYVYQRNAGRLNETALTPSQLSYVMGSAGADASGLYYVTALYEDGESYPSDQVGISTDVAAIDSSDAAITVLPEGVMISGCDGTTAAVYSLDGKTVASVRCNGITMVPLEKGVYVVKAGRTVAKAVIR